MGETEKIIERYERRESSGANKKYSDQLLFTKNLIHEREKKYKEILTKKFSDLSGITMFEIGAGNGNNLKFFNKLGIPYQNIFANELLNDRVKELKKNYPLVTIFPGDAMQLKLENRFDLMFQSGVFTSIMDSDFKKKLAQKLFDMTKPDGLVLWYDFIYNNPNNKDVKGVSISEIKSLFPHAKKIEFTKVTLAPPVGRKIGRLYNLVNSLFPFLRTHVIAVIYK